MKKKSKLISSIFNELLNLINLLQGLSKPLSLIIIFPCHFNINITNEPFPLHERNFTKLFLKQSGKIRKKIFKLRRKFKIQNKMKYTIEKKKHFHLVVVANNRCRECSIAFLHSDRFVLCSRRFILSAP